MAQHEEIVLWLDRRWKNAIEKHLKGERAAGAFGNCAGRAL